MPARQIFYEGRVQGVGFRYSIHQIAKGFEISGWVKNLADGRVEMLAATTDPEELEAFLLAIRESDLAAFIKNETPHIIPTPQNLRGFEIKT